MKAKTQGASEIAIKADWLRQWMPITLILLLAAVLYLYHIGIESLWIDELFSVLDAKELKLNAVRPLYFILLHAWMFFSTSDAWLRGLGVLFGLGSVFLTYQLGRRVAGELTGIVAALLLAVSPLFINHAQEVRMYTLSTFLSLAGTLILTDVLERPNTASIRWWAGARLLAILTTPLNITLLLPDIVLFGWRFRHQRRLLLNFGKWLLLLGILCVPTAIGMVFATPGFMSDWVALLPKPGVFDILFTLTTFTGWTFDPPFKAIAPFYVNIYFKLYALILLGLLSLALLNKKNPRLLWVAAWAFLPSAIIFAISRISSSIWVDRYLLFVCPYVLILLAAGFTQIWRRQRTVAIMLALIYTLTLGAALERFYRVQEREDWRSLTQTIAFNEKPGDFIGLPANNSRPLLALAHYYHGSAPLQAIDILTKTDKSSVKQVFRTLPPIKSRLWLIFRVNPKQKQQLQMFHTAVREQFHVQKLWTFQSLELFLVKPFSAKEVK